jgi:excisionase family DNA binding protein
MKRVGEKRLTPNEAATLLNVSVEKVRAWCESGDLPSYRSVHKWRLIDRNDLIRFTKRFPAESRMQEEGA